MKPNMRPGLLPPEGTMWRGATIETPPNNKSGHFTGGWGIGADPQEFEDYYGQPLHIYRNFNEKSNASLTGDTAWQFIQDGGIIFYSIQPKNSWAEFARGDKDAEIRKYARGVASAKPAQIMVPVGYEPDLYINDNAKTAATPGKARGTIEDYHAMWERFD